jgi:hypothetical protein
MQCRAVVSSRSGCPSRHRARKRDKRQLRGRIGRREATADRAALADRIMADCLSGLREQRALPFHKLITRQRIVAKQRANSEPRSRRVRPRR